MCPSESQASVLLIVFPNNFMYNSFPERSIKGELCPEAFLSSMRHWIICLELHQKFPTHSGQVHSFYALVDKIFIRKVENITEKNIYTPLFYPSPLSKKHIIYFILILKLRNSGIKLIVHSIIYLRHILDKIKWDHCLQPITIVNMTQFFVHRYFSLLEAQFLRKSEEEERKISLQDQENTPLFWNPVHAGGSQHYHPLPCPITKCLSD